MTWKLRFACTCRFAPSLGLLLRVQPHRELAIGCRRGRPQHTQSLGHFRRRETRVCENRDAPTELALARSVATRLAADAATHPTTAYRTSRDHTREALRATPPQREALTSKANPRLHYAPGTKGPLQWVCVHLPGSARAAVTAFLN